MIFLEHDKNETIENNAAQKDDAVEQFDASDLMKKRSTGKKRQFLSLLMSGLLGGIISATIIIVLLINNLIPIQSNKQGNENITASTTISNDLLNDLDLSDTKIEDTSKAIVGIINLQQQDIWSESQEVGAGSGIIYKKENGKAYIVTNNHVVENAKQVKVDIGNDEQVMANVIGSDKLTDLAVLEMDAKNVDTIATLGSSKDLEIGETVVAIGNPLGMDFAGSVTKGIISGLNRSIKVDTNGDNQPDWVTEVIQTDAAINPGNSGGALVNKDGEIIGINSMKIARQEVEGIGFAIPIDTALPIMEQLEKEGEITRPQIGISTVEMNQVPLEYQHKIILPEDKDAGMVIAQVQPGSPAEKAGLQQFDVITKINNQEIKSILDLRVYMYNETTVGDQLKMEFYRDGKPKTIELTLVSEEKIQS